MTLAKVLIRKGAQHRVENGHPWVYQTEIDYIDGDFNPGDIVDVYNYRHKFIGRGYINPKSQIIIRIMSRKQETIDRNFIKSRIEQAWLYRKKFLAEPEFCRLIHGEADFLPALIIDKFGKYFVVQTLSLGIEQYKDIIVSVLQELFDPEGIFERNDVGVRELEGLECKKGFLQGRFSTMIEVMENGLIFEADIENGQKTGFFYDQRDNRRLIQPVAKQAEVLDCFCHTGSFAVHAAVYGAKHITAVDISEHAIEMAKRNADKNKVSNKCDFQVANAFDFLREQTQAKNSYDLVILDPPAFAKTRSAIEGAARGYKEINLRGLKLVKPGGYLVTCSCSHHMDRELFKAIVVDAARDARKTIRQIEYTSQAKDHPILPSAPETEYLKFLMVQVQE